MASLLSGGAQGNGLPGVGTAPHPSPGSSSDKVTFSLGADARSSPPGEERCSCFPCHPVTCTAHSHKQVYSLGEQTWPPTCTVSILLTGQEAVQAEITFGDNMLQLVHCHILGVEARVPGGLGPSIKGTLASTEPSPTDKELKPSLGRVGSVPTPSGQQAAPTSDVTLKCSGKGKFCQKPHKQGKPRGEGQAPFTLLLKMSRDGKGRRHRACADAQQRHKSGIPMFPGLHLPGSPCRATLGYCRVVLSGYAHQEQPGAAAGLLSCFGQDHWLPPGSE